MKFIKSISYLIIFFVLFGCNSNDGKIEFTFLQLNDVYEIASIQGGEFGGLARVETVHQQLLKENKNTLLVMAGDFLNPSLIGTLKIDGERIRGKQMIEVMNAMNFDVVAFGNHEFDVSKEDLQKRLNESNFEWISENIQLKIAEKTMPFYQERNGKKNEVKGTFIKEFSDADGTTVKVGFISVCIPSNPKEYVVYKNELEEITKAYHSIKNKVDVVFGLTHVKKSTDIEIAKLLPEIPLIMGGHEHTNMKIPVGNSVITKANANAKTVFIHRILYDKRTKKTIVLSELKEINATIPSDKKVGKIVNKWQNILKNKISDLIANPNEVIFNAEIPLDGRDTLIRSTQTNLGEIITKSMSFAYENQVDCALVNGGSIRIDDALEGAITPTDVFRIFPYGGAVLKVELKGSLLIKVLEYGQSAAGTGAYLQRFNAQKVKNIWAIQQEPIKKNKIYTVAFSDYLLKGFDIPFLSDKNPEVLNVYRPKNDEISFNIRKSVVQYLKIKN